MADNPYQLHTYTVLLAAANKGGGVSEMFETELEAGNDVHAFAEAMKLQNWTPEDGGWLVSAVHCDGRRRLVIHDNNDPRKCYLDEGDPIH